MLSFSKAQACPAGLSGRDVIGVAGLPSWTSRRGVLGWAPVNSFQDNGDAPKLRTDRDVLCVAVVWNCHAIPGFYSLSKPDSELRSRISS